MTLNVDFEDLPSLEGRTFELTEFRVLQDEVNIFEDVIGMTKIYEDSSMSEYPSGMIEGFHSLSLVDAITQSLVRANHLTTYALNYGVNHLRFPRSITVHDSLWYRMKVKSVVARGEGYLLTYDIAVGVVGEEKPGLVVEWLQMVFRRASDEKTTRKGDAGVPVKRTAIITPIVLQR